MNTDKKNTPIDIVIIWVDGNDPEWQKERAKYNPEGNTDSSVARYRDWDNLKYVFRGIEQFAPWVNKVFFVTWWHLPKWLNIDCPKLKIVKHEDYIPAEYLPTFSTHPIELNIHRINGLSEHFIYFNDDMFLIQKTKPEDFFKNGKPCDSAILSVHSYSEASYVSFAALRATGLINKYFDFRRTIKANLSKWINPKYGKMLLRSLVLLGCPMFPGFWQHHLPPSCCKSTYTELWKKEYDLLNETSLRKFRHTLNVNQWFFRNWEIASGNFYPRSVKKTGKYFGISNIEDIYGIKKYIENQKGKMICLNDEVKNEDDFYEIKNTIALCLEKFMPDKSEFEI